MNRDNQGRFTSFKSKVERVAVVTVLGGLVVSCIYAGISTVKLHAVEAGTATSTGIRIYAEVSRVDQVQQMIDKLAAQREQDADFIAETKKQEEDLKKNRHEAAVEGALLMIKTRYDMQVYELYGKKN